MDTGNDIAVTRRLTIPLAEIAWEFATASGPGGQHVNRANTKATLVFDLAGSPSVSDRQREAIRGAMPGRISGEGLLRVTCGRHRSQSQNRDECLERFRALLRSALQPAVPRRATRPTRASRERRLDTKKHRSRRKSTRQRPSDW